MRSLERSSPSSADACGRTAALRDLRRNDPRHLSKSFMDCGRTASPGGAVGAWIVREAFVRLPYP